MSYTRRNSARPSALICAGALASLLLLSLTFHAAPPASAARAEEPGPGVATAALGDVYVQTNYVSDVPGFALLEDRLLVDPRGLDLTPTDFMEVANAGTQSATFYSTNQQNFPHKNFFPFFYRFTLPGGTPSGVVYPGDNRFFFINNGSTTRPASAIYCTLAGEIVAWSHQFPPPGDTTAYVVASRPGRRYTGIDVATLAFAPPESRDFIYAVDFAGDRIDVYDRNFNPVTTEGNFQDPRVPPEYHPFNIRNSGNTLYVTYARVGSDGEPVFGAGEGYVGQFGPTGLLFPFLIQKGALNAPYAVAVAPADFGQFSNCLLVGNFGPGGPSVNAYTLQQGTSHAGSLKNEAGEDIVIPGLRALRFGLSPGGTNTLFFTAGIDAGRHGLLGALRPTTQTATSFVQFASGAFSIGEGSGHIDVMVTRSGDASGTATVNYNTSEMSAGARASQKSDYEIALGTLTFAPGETSKTFRLLVVDDRIFEGDESVPLTLSNPTGAGVGLGSPAAAELTITDNDQTLPATNPIGETAFFVRQHYLDFLNREPDAAGLAFWTNQIESCGADAQCREVRRINVSAAFFLSIEFQQTGLLAYLTHRAAFGDMSADFGAPVPVLYGTFQRDTQALQRGFAFGQTGADAVLEANKQAYFNAFVLRPDFLGLNADSTPPAQFVDSLYGRAGVTPSAAERQAAIDEFGGASDTANHAARARVLRRVAENESFRVAEFNRAFVLMEYFGYLRRDPDEDGYNFWLSKLNAFNGNYIAAEMVKAFISSDEYRGRFGP
ncbi:MAG: TIGR03118 family protein [Pyrinomonadaceae bacterium]